MWNLLGMKPCQNGENYHRSKEYAAFIRVDETPKTNLETFFETTAIFTMPTWRCSKDGPPGKLKVSYENFIQTTLT
jgi:hypothetical protein